MSAGAENRSGTETNAFDGELVVAIDGPSGSGKTSVSRAVARRLGLAFLDTGAMYRALTWYCLDSGLDLAAATAAADEKLASDVVEAAVELPLIMGLDPEHETVEVDGQDITAVIRDPRISAAVSAVATNTAARAVLVERQRRLIEQTGRRVVAEGRDITTVVAPDATARILLTASPEARMGRRGHQLGGTQTDADLHRQVVQRDARDSTVVDFMTAAAGVTTVDSTELDFAQTVDAVIDVIRASKSNTAK
ncbi:cytidylate kinase [Tersicoccus phoenicis]|uniref:Cytidylate kinase n=1 Tax=Tersicoccus phoenicis TaxID=554083 RepID=A0A1R1L7E2_9MICC|nr:(d)CMP kinase [Tersicoccus phoenicis]OMH23470.1 cytidylate kinase [Tersicoccus phoenicis]